MAPIIATWLLSAIGGALGIFMAIHIEKASQMKFMCWVTYGALCLLGLVVALWCGHEEDVKDKAQEDASALLSGQIKDANDKLDVIASTDGINIKGGDLNQRLASLIDRISDDEKKSQNLKAHTLTDGGEDSPTPPVVKSPTSTSKP